MGVIEALEHIFGVEKIKNLPLSEVPHYYSLLAKADELSVEIPIYVRNNHTIRTLVSDRVLQTGEAIEVLEFQRLFSESEDHNQQFNLAITMAAILVRPEGASLPSGRGVRDRFIRVQKEYWIDEWTYGDHLALTKWFSKQIVELQEIREFQFFWNGRPKVRSRQRKSQEILDREQLNAEISNILGLRAHYLLWKDLYQTFEEMFYSDFRDFTFRANLKIGVGQ